jgi:hypothetical protein
MVDEGAGSQGSLPLGGGGQAGSATVDWSNGGVEHFGSFRESLGDLGKDKSLEPIKDFKGMASSFVNAQKMIGRGIFLPDEKAKPEDKQKAIDGIMQKLRANGVLEAVPETPDKYEIRLPQADAQGEPFKANEPLIKSFKDAIHKLKVSPSVAQGLFDWYLNFQAESEAAEEVSFEQTKSNLKKEFGGLYPRKMEAARRAVFKYMGEDGDSLISTLPPEIGAKLVRAFSLIGDPLLEDDIVTGNLTGMPSADDIWKKMTEMQSQPAADISHAAHAIWVKEYNNLNNQHAQLKARK